ncbi:hypothetical protein Acsp06_41560 [Actinomycetospora sp. NBRC 106375]|uniref:hypothetical protein n=1 Tax=Actinomycetospora sp. NBRC 106375 TaxID=3032207 RepID=UPI0024A47DC5|nr:hypothetical protein [Actinomycetospora sp. NBRC 106375]GLZ47971.1 hypothetical protein Acsp06_41560 [Actinomycetospora sp. NBRC 106375]
MTNNNPRSLGELMRAAREDVAAVPPVGEGEQRSPAQWLVELLGAAKLAHSGGKWQCPAHGRTGEHSAALSVQQTTKTRRAMIHCHYGCTVDEVLGALALHRRDLTHTPTVPPAGHAHREGLDKIAWPPLRAPVGGEGSLGERGFRFEAFHDYGPDHRKARYRHPSGAKELRWETRQGGDAWMPGLIGIREDQLPLYREPDIAIGVAAGERILLVESESSVDALAGWYATTWAGGASSPALERLRRVLGDAQGRLVIIPDADDAGRAAVAKLTGALPQARVLWPDDGEDARDLLARIGGRAFLKRVTAVLAEQPAVAPDEAAADEVTADDELTAAIAAIGEDHDDEPDDEPEPIETAAPPPPVTPTTVPSWRECPECRRVAAAADEPMQCEACAQASVIVFERANRCTNDAVTAYAAAGELELIDVRRCPTPRCGHPTRHGADAGLCQCCYDNPRAGQPLDGRGARNLSPRDALAVTR